MSVINRMLTDLERRGAPGARRQRAADGPERSESPRRALRWLRHMAPSVLLVALLIVAAALWWEQWPRLLTMVESRHEPPAAGDTVTDAPASSEPSLPEVHRFVFERDGAATRLIVAFDRPLEEAPGYGRSADRIGLQLPARWDQGELPAPPSDQSVYRSAVVDERGDEGTRIGMRVDPDARFDLAIDGDRLTLTGRVPSAAGDGDAKAQSVSAPSDAASKDEMESATDLGMNGSAASEENGAGASTGTAEVAAQSEQTRQARDEKSDTDAGATDGQDSTDGSSGTDAAGGDGGTRTAAADDGTGSGQAATRADEADGQVRKSEPDIAPEERARRLEAKGREALDDGDVAAARDHLARALEFDADRHTARDLLVGLALRSGDTRAARNLLAQGVARAPERGAYAKPFARLLVDAGDLERALRVLRRAAPAADRDGGYHGLTAAVAQRLKRHELAASEYTRALEIDSSRGVWWMGLGISLRATDHPDEALAAFREARASGDLTERLDRWVQQRIDALSRTGE